MNWMKAGLFTLFMTVLTFQIWAADSHVKLIKGVTVAPTTVPWRFWNYQSKGDHSIEPFTSKREMVETNFHAFLIENEFVKVTVLPEFGGRVLSIIYKPTGHEELYQNPVGAPYGNEGKKSSFYYSWLMVYGGIFPTFPEPEHGKAWCVPWGFEVSSNGSRSVSIKMTYTDNTEFSAHPDRFTYGITGLTCEETVTVYAMRSSVDFDFRLINNTPANVSYEYWTCATLTPGSKPGDPKSPDNSHIVAPISKIKLKDEWWSWMGTSETLLDASNHIFAYKNLAEYTNWKGMGIAYAIGLTNCWWGVINEDNQEGILRIADNQNQTPGMKYWTWGYEQGRSSDPASPSCAANGRRPYIELWGGHSPEFFSNAVIASNSVKSWRETYYPVVGLNNVDFANSNAAAKLSAVLKDNQVEVSVELFSPTPDLNVLVSISWVPENGKEEAIAESRTVSFAADKPLLLSGMKPKTLFKDGKGMIKLRVMKDKKTELLAGMVPLVLP